MFKAKSGSFTFPIGKLTVSVGFTPSHYCSNQVYTGKIVPAPPPRELPQTEWMNHNELEKPAPQTTHVSDH